MKPEDMSLEEWLDVPEGIEIIESVATPDVARFIELPRGGQEGHYAVCLCYRARQDKSEFVLIIAGWVAAPGYFGVAPSVCYKYQSGNKPIRI